jgi:hypothetical protein
MMDNASNCFIFGNNCSNTTTGKSEWGVKVVIGTGNVIMNNIFATQDTSDIQIESTTRDNVILGNICKDPLKIVEVDATLSKSQVQSYQDSKWGFMRSSPTYTVDVAGTMWVGTSTVSGTQFEQDGTMVATGNATTWDDLFVVLNPSSQQFAPTYATYKSGKLLEFSDESTNEDRISFVTQMPHSYKIGSAVYPHLHWVGQDNTAGAVAWKLEYTTATINGVFTVTTTSTTYAQNSSITDNHTITGLGTIPGDRGISGVILGTLYRNSTNALDTYNGKNVYLLQLDIHYEKDTLGSRTELTK